MLPARAGVSTAVYRNDSSVINTDICSRAKICAAALFGILSYSSLMALSLAMVPTSAACLCRGIYRNGPCCKGNVSNRVFATSATVSHMMGATRKYSSIMRLGVIIVPTVRVSAIVDVGSNRVCRFNNGVLNRPNGCSRAFASSRNYSSVIRLALAIRAKVRDLFNGSLFLTPGPIRTGNIACVGNSFTQISYGKLGIRVLGSINRIISDCIPTSFPVRIGIPSMSNVCCVHVIAIANRGCIRGVVMG